MQSCGNTLNQHEQNVVRDYCQEHELIRPDTDVKKIVIWILGIEISSITLAYILYCMFCWVSVIFSFGALYSGVSVILYLIFLKRICIILIELYQHYASENTRRKCVMMPSCSEYALLALKKYNVFKGLYKSYIRMTTKCNGSYKIDYP
jgi:putative component of membrane protein insertase Oxa1/YidC/SpoIIIJ protein YidD